MLSKNEKIAIGVTAVTFVVLLIIGFSLMSGGKSKSAQNDEVLVPNYHPSFVKLGSYGEKFRKKIILLLFYINFH
jgi:hypothetical protein